MNRINTILLLSSVVLTLIAVAGTAVADVQTAQIMPDQASTGGGGAGNITPTPTVTLTPNQTTQPTPTTTQTVNPTPTLTANSTPIQTVNPTPVITIPTVTPTQTATVIPAIAHTPIISKSAELIVVYEIGAGNDRQHYTVTIHIRNIGNATASYINANFKNPSQVEARILSGGDQVEDTFTWKGELKPSEEHSMKYSVKAVVGQEIGIPYNITYAKISPEEKAMALGISVTPENAEALLSPSDWITIFCELWIKLSPLLPGFEITSAGAVLILIVYLHRNRRKTK